MVLVAPLDRFPLVLHQTARMWRQALDRRLRHLGVSQTGWLAIATIANSKSCLSQVELANALALEGASVVAMVNRLVKLGFVQRQYSTQDRRIRHVVATKQGLEIYEKVRSEAASFREEILGGVDAERLEEMTKLLEVLIMRIEAHL